jgi:U3 small nucleolar ribonucleoprotein component
MIGGKTLDLNHKNNFYLEMKVLIRALFSSVSAHALCTEFCNKDIILLDDLTTYDLNSEQIWQQIELQLKNFLINSLKRLEKLELGKDFLHINFVALKSNQLDQMSFDAQTSRGREEQQNQEEFNVMKLKARIQSPEVKRTAHTNTFDQERINNPLKTDAIVSAFQSEQEKVSRKIMHLETEAIREKDWSYLGESSCRERPKNSVLELDLEFEQRLQSKPNISIEASTRLESIIKERIVSKRWDNVEKSGNFKTPSPNQFIDLIDEKNKNGLGEIYAEEYFKKGQQIVAEKLIHPISIISEAQNTLRSLLVKLDYLTLFRSVTTRAFIDQSSTRDFEVSGQNLSDSKEISKSPEEIYALKGSNIFKTMTSSIDQQKSRNKRKNISKEVGVVFSESHKRKMMTINSHQQKKPQ